MNTKKASAAIHWWNSLSWDQREFFTDGQRKHLTVHEIIGYWEHSQRYKQEEAD